MAKKDATVELVVDLGDLKPAVQKAAKNSGVSMNEFICNALDSKVRREQDYETDRFVRHGGKHLMGKHTGYEVTKDGKYFPAPTWTQQFELLFAERSAIYNLANAVVAQLQERLIEVEKKLTEAKEGLVDDLGLDPTKNWVYYGGKGGRLEEQKADSDKPENE